MYNLSVINMDDDIPPFLGRVFPDRAKNQENTASLGKATQGKAVKGKAAKGLDIGIVPQQLSLERSEQVDDQNGFTRDDEQDGSGALDRASAGAKVEEIKSTREVALEEELDLWKSRYVKLESYYKNLEASVEIARKNSLGLSFPTPNAKAMSVCDDIDEADAAADDNAKATSVHNDLVYPMPQPMILPKATSVHDELGHDVVMIINDADAYAADDNAKATSVHGNVGIPDAAADDNAKIYPSIHGFQIMLWGDLEKKGDDLDEAKANQESRCAIGIHMRLNWIHGKSLDEGLVPLISHQDLLSLLKYVPSYKEIEVYVEKHMMEVVSGKGKGVVIKEIMEDDKVNEANDEAEENAELFAELDDLLEHLPFLNDELKENVVGVDAPVVVVEE
ncbi:hypothetical protein Tco_0516445 [Tanacetum coccineum]